MKNEKDQKDDRSPKSNDQRGGNQRSKKSTKQNILEGGRGANQNDDRSEDSKGGGNHGLGDQEGANQGNYQGGSGRH